MHTTNHDLGFFSSSLELGVMSSLDDFLVAHTRPVPFLNGFYGTEHFVADLAAPELGHHIQEAQPFAADRLYHDVPQDYSTLDTHPRLQASTYNAWPHGAPHGSVACSDLPAPQYIDPRIFEWPTSTNETPSIHHVTLTPAPYINDCRSLSPTSTISTEGSASSVASSAAPSRSGSRTGAVVHQSTRRLRQSKRAKTVTAKSKVAQFPQIAVLNALKRRSLRERKASEDPCWDGRLACELCGMAYESKSLQRHLESHGRESSSSAWVCCGVADEEGGRVHGCGFKFYHRRDALARHIKHTSCLGEPEEIQRHIRRAREDEKEVYPGVS
ncbi:hypothetical protein PENSPDRAFT_749942 [Peniophora sp. CONT]|nr:hypothetical protein PENSPDRAFT_749942 [Peniophora sp. CONT]